MKKILTGALSLIILIASLFTMTACTITREVPESEDLAQVQTAVPYSLSVASAEPMAETASNTYSQTLTAIIKPESMDGIALINWELSWNNNNEGSGATVTDYLKLTSSEDTRVATIEILKPFPNSTINIKASNERFKISSTCLARYVGRAEDIESVTTSQEVMSSSLDLGLDTSTEISYFLYEDTNYVFDISETNAFDNVTENYVPDYKIFGQQDKGTLSNEKLVYNVSYRDMSDNETSNEDKEYTLSGPTDYVKSFFIKREGLPAYNNFANVSIVENKLHINTYQNFSSYAPFRYSDGVYDGVFSYVRGEEKYSLTIRDCNAYGFIGTGYHYKVNFSIYPRIESFSLSSTELAF